MSGNGRRQGRWWLVGLAALVLLAVGLWALRAEPPRAEEGEVAAAAPARPVARPPPPPSPPRVAEGPVGGTSPELESLDKLLQVPAPEEGPPAEYPVKMEQLQERLPDNLYWKTSAPTKDPEELRRRDEEARRWNEVFGKVQAGEASEEEIHRYYDYRRQLSEDHIAIAAMMLNEYGEHIPERDQGLLALSIQMHRTRLDEIPRQIEEALARKELQDKRRDEWIRGGQGAGPGK